MEEGKKGREGADIAIEGGGRFLTLLELKVTHNLRRRITTTRFIVKRVSALLLVSFAPVALPWPMGKQHKGRHSAKRKRKPSV
jgi:hypothetical protein